MRVKEDSYYIGKVLHGDVQAFTPLVDKYKHMAYTLALKIVAVPEDAEEVAQDAFVKAFQSLSSFKGESKFSTWLYTIVYHAALSRARKKQQDLVSLDDEKFRTFDVTETDHFLMQMHASEQDKVVRRAIDKLPADEQALITLYYLNESSVREITQITGDSESNVKVKLFRARKKLWDILHPYFHDKTPA